MDEKKCVHPVTMPSAPLYAGHGSQLALLVDNQGKVKGSNAQKEKSAIKILPPPINMAEAIRLKDYSTHHAACILTKKNCAIGLGFLTEKDSKSGSIDPENKEQMVSLLTGAPYVRSKVDDVLDELTLYGVANELADWVEDYLDTGCGYLEVAREGEKITYIGQLPATTVKICKQDRNFFYQVREDDGTMKYFSRFGVENKRWLLDHGPYQNSKITLDEISEIIYLPESSNRCKYYGYPSWLAASVDIDLLKKAKQYKADFYWNRGVLDFILTVTGQEVPDKDWNVITSTIQSASEMGSKFKNMSLNFGNPEAKVQVDKLAADMATEEQFAKDNEVFSQNIVSAHGVPPLLANILIPGKLGASNEFVNSLTSFQLLRIGPMQGRVQNALASTLGNPDLNGGLGLTPKDFQLRTVTSQLNLQAFDTVGRMREEATTAGDRDLNKGVKD